MTGKELVFTVLDALVDGGYSAGPTMLGYMIASGGPVVPSKAAVMVALVTGAVGALNQLRALRKQPR